MQTIKNGRKRGCGSCGQSESYESMQLSQPITHGLINGQSGNVLSVHNTTGRNIREVRFMAQLPMAEKLAA